MEFLGKCLFRPLALICFRVSTANVRLLEISQVERSIRYVEFIHCGGRQLRKSTRGRSLFMPGVAKKGLLTFLMGEEGRDQRKFLKFGRNVQLRYRGHYFFVLRRGRRVIVFSRYCSRFLIIPSDTISERYLIFMCYIFFSSAVSLTVCIV